MTSPKVAIGVDPGGRYTGIVIRSRDEVIDAVVVDRRKVEAIDPADVLAWARYVTVTVADHREVAPYAVLGVEMVQPPNPHVRRRDGNSLTNVAGILDTAVVVGALALAFVDLVPVDPGGNGAQAPNLYPSKIGPGARLGGPSDHARAAFDVAGAARWRARLTPTGRTHP